jgi:hypothetical protein
MCCTHLFELQGGLNFMDLMRMCNAQMLVVDPFGWWVPCCCFNMVVRGLQCHPFVHLSMPTFLPHAGWQHVLSGVLCGWWLLTRMAWSARRRWVIKQLRCNCLLVAEDV